MRSSMSEHDASEIGLIDVNGLSLAELREVIDASSLESALGLIFDPRPEDPANGFDSYI
jgi:hypothetical protein